MKKNVECARLLEVNMLSALSTKNSSSTLGPPDVAGEAEVDMTKENFDMLQVLEFI